MRKLVISAALAAFSVPAFASDLPSTKTAPAPVFTAVPAPFSWTGFYAGLEGGADFMNMSGALNNAAPWRDHKSGGQLGGMIGYNRQIGMVVLGVEANGDGVIGGKLGVTATDPLGNSYGITSQHTYDADVRGRVGVAIDRALIFAAGGVAFGDVMTNSSGAALASPSAFSAQRTGWTVGGGMEYAFTNNIIGRAEYRYSNLGTASYTNAAAGASDKVRFDSNSALLGVMYKFGQ